MTTQVQQNGVWGINVGGTFYASKGSTSAQGYQVLVLGRSYTPASTTNPPLAYNPGGAATPNPYLAIPMVNNQFFTITNSTTQGTTDLKNMATALLQPATYGSASDACGGTGCYVIISSQGGLGFTTCSGKDSTAKNCDLKAQPGGVFAQMGGTSSASYAPSTAAYSLVTTVVTNGSTTPLFPGVGRSTESLGCALQGSGTAGQTSCLGRSPNGVINGAFVAYLGASTTITFTTTNPVSITAKSNIPNVTNTNTVTVQTSQGTTTYTSAPIGIPGFQIVALDRTTMQLLLNGTFSPTATGDSGNDLNSFLQNFFNQPTLAGENVIWVVATTGPVQNTGVGMYAFAQALATIGGSFSVVNQLGVAPPNNASCPNPGDYALIGWRQPDQAATGITPSAGLEASGGMLCQTQGPSSAAAAAVTVQALLKPDTRSFYTPQASSGLAGNSGLQAAVLQGTTTSWPPSAAPTSTSIISPCPTAPVSIPAGTQPTAGQAAAYTYLSQVIQSNDTYFVNNPGHPDIRLYYTEVVNSALNNGPSEPNGWYDSLKAAAATYPQNSYFSCQDYNGALAQLETEVLQLVNVATYTQTMNTAFSDALGSTILNYQNMKTFITDEVNPGDNTPVGADLLSYLGTVVGDLLPIALPGVGDIAGPGFDAITQTIVFGLGVANDGTTHGPTTTINTTWNQLDGQLGNVINGAQNGLQTAMLLAVTDSDRLSQAGYATGQFNAIALPGTNAAPTSDDIATQIANGLAGAALTSVVGSLYSSVTLRALWGDPKPDITTVAYPTVAQSPGGSIHRAVCQGNGTCLAEAQGHGYNQAQAYPMDLTNTQQPSGATGQYYWQTSMMFLTSSCSIETCMLYFPSQNILSVLFDQLNTNVTISNSKNPYEVPALGLWADYVLGQGGFVSPTPLQTPNSYFLCIISRGEDEPACNSSVAVSPPSTSTAPKTTASSPEASEPVSGFPANVAIGTPEKQTSDALARTGLAFNPLWLVSIAVLLIVVGFTLTVTTRRRQRKRISS